MYASQSSHVSQVCIPDLAYRVVSMHAINYGVDDVCSPGDREDAQPAALPSRGWGRGTEHVG